MTNPDPNLRHDHVLDQRRARRAAGGALAAALGLLLLGMPVLGGCRAAPIENRDPVGEVLPAVAGHSLSGELQELPAELRGAPAILILGYVQDAQFDADRWLFGLLQAETPVRVLELPTIKSRVASWFGDRIDSGMRSGIPSEDWGAVVTVYGAGARELVALTGNVRPRNVRVLLLDAESRVQWFHDRGFSAGTLLELDRAARGLVSN